MTATVHEIGAVLGEDRMGMDNITPPTTGGRWKPGKLPTSHRDSLVVVVGRWRPGNPSSQLVGEVEGRWKPGNPLTSRHDLLVVVVDRWRTGNPSSQLLGEVEGR